MLIDTFGFREDPFPIDPNVRFFYYDAARQHIHAHLASNIRNGKGLILLSGERGIGKTILLRHLANKLEAANGIILLPSSGMLSCKTSPSFSEIVRACRESLDAECDAGADNDDETGLAQFLERRNKPGTPAALILDGADQLPHEVLDRLMALSALFADKQVGLSIVLTGCLEAQKGQNDTALEAIRRSADVSLRLQRFQTRDVEPYICHRVQLAGRKGPALFAPSAIDRIVHHSSGNPLSINRICRSALVIAGKQTVKTVSADIVDHVAAGSLRGSISERSWTTRKGSAHNLHVDRERPHVARANATNSSNGPARFPLVVSEESTSATSETEDKFLFRTELNQSAGKTESATAVTRVPVPRPIPLEDYALGEHTGMWSHERVGTVVRFVWAFLATTLLVGVTGVYLAQTGRFDAIETSKRWLALIHGQENTQPQSTPRGQGTTGEQPSFWVEPSNKMNGNYPLETASNTFGVDPRRPQEEKQPNSGTMLQDGEAPAKLGSEPRLDQRSNHGSLPTSSELTSALDGTAKKIGPETGSKPVTDNHGSSGRLQLADTQDPSVKPTEASNVSKSTVGTEPSIHLNELLTSRPEPSAMETAAGSKTAVDNPGVAVDADTATEADEALANQSMPIEMETAAGSEKAADNPEVAVDADTATEADVALPSQLTPIEMETTAGSATVVDRPKVAVDEDTTTRVDVALASQSTPIEMETTAGSATAVNSLEATVDVDTATEADELLTSQPLPNEKETELQSDETIRKPKFALAAGLAMKANEPALQPDRSSREVPVSEATGDRPPDLQSAAISNQAQEVAVAVRAGLDLTQKDRPFALPQRPELKVRELGEPSSSLKVAESNQSQLDLDRLIDRGEELLALGDISSARLFFRLASTKGSAKGATAMGSTYDPVYLERVGIFGIRPSPPEAIKWYRQARDMGHREADVQLRELIDRLEREAALGDREAQQVLKAVRN